MGCVWIQRAPAWSLRWKRSTSRSTSSAAGFNAAPTQNDVGSPMLLPVASSPSFIRRRISMSPTPSTSTAAVEGVSAQQVGLDPHEISVATGEVHVDVEPRRLADQERGRQHRHADTSERAVVDVDDVDAPLLEELRALDEL